METFLIIALAATTCWFAWRNLSLRRGILALTRIVDKDQDGNGNSFPSLQLARPLDRLGISTIDALTEATLTSESEQRHRKFLEALLNEINDAIFVLDGEREIQFANKAARKLFPSDQPYAARPFLNICRDHRIYDTLILAEQINAKTSDNIPLRTHDQGSNRIQEINLLVEVEPLQFSDGQKKAGSWILMRDVTAELETEQIRRDFIANASHELRTPLSIINGYLETMDDADVDLNQAIFRRAIRTMNKHGQRIARIVEDMLMISKLENAQELLNLQPFDLRESLDEMISQLMPLIEEKHARVKVKADERDSWIISGDRYYWDQIFFNLIENSLKQNTEPGLNITITFHAKNGRIVIAIADDGIGIPAQDLPLIFKRFYRVQKHHAQTEVKGTGLGLSIVKRAVEAHRGKVKVDSQPGIETAFTISIPDTSAPVVSEIPTKDET